MHPIPCSHCGTHFMRRNLHPDAQKLCNTCEIKEEKRNPKGDKTVEYVNILIKCPFVVHKEIEEKCISEGIDLSQYFMGLHHKVKTEVSEEEKPSKKVGKK